MPKDNRCSASPDGKHDPDPASVAPAYDAGRNRGTDWIVEVCCQYCQRLGSMYIDPKDIQWD
jgi:hypothetical protein